MTRSSKRMPQAMQQVGFLNGVVDPRLAVHAHHAQVQRMRGREAAEAEQRGGDGNLRAFGESANLLLARRIGRCRVRRE